MEKLLEPFQFSFMTDAMAREVTRAGGIGLSAQVSREMLKLQGLEH